MLSQKSRQKIRVFTSFQTFVYGMMEAMASKNSAAPKGSRSRIALKAVSPGRRPRAKAVRVTLCRDDWVEAATLVLLDQGIDHVRVDLLATRLGVTRGSFYWHFVDREDLLREVLQRWRRLATIELSHRILEGSSGDVQSRLRNLISLPHRGRSAVRAARIELAIRAWARRDALAREAVDEADRSRLQVHIDTFLALGFAPEESRQRAFVTYSYELGEALMHHLGTDLERQARQAFVEQLATTPLQSGR